LLSEPSLLYLKKEIRVYKLVGSTLSLTDALDIDVTVNAVDWTYAGTHVITGSTTDTRVFTFSSETLSEVASLSLGGGESIPRNALAADRTGSYYVVGIEHTTASKVQIYNFNGSAITAKRQCFNGC